MPGVSDLATITDTVKQATDTIRSTRQSWREAASRYLRRVAACLIDIHAGLSTTHLDDKQAAHVERLNHRLSTYAGVMPKTVRKILGKKQAETLRLALARAASARGEFMLAAQAARQDDKASKAANARFLKSLNKAAGALDAAADIIEAS